MSGLVLAAGVLVWRRTPKGLKVLLVERTQHRDVSIPKGKLDPGETLPGCAERELREETGVAATLRAPLGTSEYRLPGGNDKVVYYWHAEVSDDDVAESSFTPNDEIAGLEWVTLPRAKERVTYAHDVRIIERFEALVARDAVDTFALIAVRHGKAVDPFSWDGPDETRTLTHRGREQARGIASGLAAFGASRIQSSPADRCLETVQPLATRTGIEVKAKRSLGQDAYFSGGKDAAHRVRSAIAKRQGTVLCTHAPVLTRIVDAVAGATDTVEDGSLRRAAMLHTAEFSVFHVTRAESPRLIAVETHDAPDA